MSGKIFINYRRGDDAGNTGRLFDRLQDVFQPEQLFLDVDNIAPGLDFVRELNDRVAECDIVLAIIGKGWLDARNAEGARRLDDPDDFVRIEIESALNQGKRVIPVLVGDGQLPRAEDLPEPLQALTRRNAVRLTHERFRADVAGLVKALQQSLQEIEARREAEAEALRRVQAEEERRRLEAEAARRAEAEELKRKADIEAQAKAKLRAEAERAFAVAKRDGTFGALDGFLAAHGASAFADEARQLRVALRARDEAYQRTVASNDPAALRMFVATYSKGADVVEVRKHLRRLEGPGQQSASSRPTLLIAGAIAAVCVAAAVFWLERSPSPSSLPQAQSANGTPEIKAPPGPGPDEVAWSLLRDTTDDAALKRFVQQYPNSPLRKAAESRITALAAEAAARADAAAKDAAAKADAQAKAEAALKAQADQEAAAAAKLAEANKQLQEERDKQQAALSTPPDTAEPLAGPALVQQIKMELMRVGCYAGSLDGDWTAPDVKLSIANFVKSASLGKMPDQPTLDFLNSIRGQSSRVCPLQCAKTETVSNGQCIAKTCPSGQTLDSGGGCITTERTTSRPAPSAVGPAAATPAPSGQPAGGVGIKCTKYGCKEHPLVNAPAGVPCRAAWQGRDGSWHCG